MEILDPFCMLNGLVAHFSTRHKQLLVFFYVCSSPLWFCLWHRFIGSCARARVWMVEVYFCGQVRYDCSECYVITLSCTLSSISFNI